MAEWTDTREEEPQEEEATASGEKEPSYWTMYFDGAFAARSVGFAAVLTSPTGDKLYYAVQLCFKDNDKVSNNIAEYEGLLAGLKAAITLGIKRILIKGDSQLLVNFSNKSYTPPPHERNKKQRSGGCRLEGGNSGGALPERSPPSTFPPSP